MQERTLKDSIILSLIEKVVRGKANNLFAQLIRYTFVGGIAFAVDFTLLFLITELLGVHYLVSAALAFTAGLVTNYSLSITWVFDKRRLSGTTKQRELDARASMRDKARRGSLGADALSTEPDRPAKSRSSPTKAITTAEFAVFGAIGVVGLGLNELCIFLFTEKVSLHYLVSKVVATALVFAWNFLARKLILFS